MYSTKKYNMCETGKYQCLPKKNPIILLFVLVLVGWWVFCGGWGGGGKLVNKSIINSKFSQENEVDCNGN